MVSKNLPQPSKYWNGYWNWCGSQAFFHSRMSRRFWKSKASVLFFLFCRKSERQIVPTKSQVHGHYLRNSSTALPYTHFRRDIPDRACMRQEEYYIDSDDYLSPAPAPPHTRVERVPESSQWAQDGKGYSTPPDSDRYVHYGNALLGLTRTSSVSSRTFNWDGLNGTRWKYWNTPFSPLIM